MYVFTHKQHKVHNFILHTTFFLASNVVYTQSKPKIWITGLHIILLPTRVYNIRHNSTYNEECNRARDVDVGIWGTAPDCDDDFSGEDLWGKREVRKQASHSDRWLMTQPDG